VRKIYHLSTCNTCQKILAQLNLNGVELVDIKYNNISDRDLDFAKNKLGSYEALFSKRALKYRQWGLNEQKLTEQDCRKYILEEYTFLKRPVAILDEKVFAGNSKSAVEGMKQTLSEINSTQK